jgi:TetR/AcrR family transcriptional repressor of nem operon
LLASQLPVLPEEIGLEVRAHFRSLSAWLTSVLERGARHGQLRLMNTPRAEAEVFMASVHGAMLSARAYGDAKIFGVITRPLLERFVLATETRERGQQPASRVPDQ